MTRPIAIPGACGQHSPRAKFTQEQVNTIRARHIDGETYKALAAEYAVSPSTIQRIVEGKSYPDTRYSALGRNLEKLKQEWANKNAPVSQAGAQ